MLYKQAPYLRRLIFNAAADTAVIFVPTYCWDAILRWRLKASVHSSWDSNVCHTNQFSCLHFVFPVLEGTQKKNRPVEVGHIAKWAITLPGKQ